MESVQKDVQLAEFMGAEFRTGQEAPSLAELKKPRLYECYLCHWCMETWGPFV